MLKLALPKGKLLPATAAWLERAGWRLTDYTPSSRSYRPRSRQFPGVEIKVFQEKDIPVQIAVGNYDLGICSRDWMEELLAKFRLSPLVMVKELGYGAGHLYLAASRLSPFSSLPVVKGNGAAIRLAGEYPNLAEAVALKLRLKRFRVFPLWGAGEVYPPEDADLVLVPAASAAAVEEWGLVPLLPVVPTTACLIAHRNSWQEKDMRPVLASLLHTPAATDGPAPLPQQLSPPAAAAEGQVRLALPDGHQQSPTLALLKRAGASVEGYAQGNRRPELGWPGVVAKVIRPQDMPLQVACGHFDVAVTGQDWLRDHLCRFPSSPVVSLLDLRFGKVKVVAVVSQGMGVASLAELRQRLWEGKLRWLRVASEYVNLADKFARDHHLSPYRVIPTWGASEAFLPEDADLLIENTQTGQTLAHHHLHIVEALFDSTACLIGAEQPPAHKRERVAEVVDWLRRGLE